MENDPKPSPRHTLNTGTGITLGASFGLLFGLLFLDGQIGISLTLGTAIGLVIGAIAEARQKQGT